MDTVYMIFRIAIVGHVIERLGKKRYETVHQVNSHDNMRYHNRFDPA